MMKLLIDDYRKSLEEHAASAIEIKALSAYLTEGGLMWLPKEKYASSQFIAGTNGRITTPEALKQLVDGGADVRVFTNEHPLFHPKAIYFKTPVGEYLVVGSNNLTFSGAHTNIEMSLLVHRNEQTDSVFQDFLDNYAFLWNHDRSRSPDKQFFENYRASDLLSKFEKLSSQPQPIQSSNVPRRTPTVDSKELKTLGDYFRLFASEFPELDRRTTTKIADHDLKRLNETKFLPLFEKIIGTTPGQRLRARSELNIGGNWRIAPWIGAVDEDREDWGKAETVGRLGMQVHFGEPESNPYTKVSLSIVIQYLIEIQDKLGQMPSPVRVRYDQLIPSLQGFRADAIEGLPQFKVFNYKDRSLWAKPMLTYEYSIVSLPSDEQICENLDSLALGLNKLMLVNR